MEEVAIQNSKETEYINSKSVILTACAISIYMIYLVSSKNFVFGSMAGNWVYPYFETVPKINPLIPFLAVILVGLSILFGSIFIHSYEKITLLLIFLNLVFVQTLICKIYPFSLGEIILSDVANSFYTPATKYSAFEILNKFNELAPTFPQHARTNMPGKILLFSVLKILTTSLEVMGFLIIALSSTGILLIYNICKELFYDRQAAFYAAILYGLIPSKLFFFPILNTVTPVFILLCLYFLIIFIEQKLYRFSWFLGIGLYFLILFEPSPLATAPIFVGVLFHSIANKKLSAKVFYKLALNLVLAFLLTHVIFNLFFSFNIFKTFNYVLNDAVSFNLNHQRPYRIWLFENAKEFFFSNGTPVTVILIFMTAQMLTKWKNLTTNKIWAIDDIYLISILTTYLIIALLGINRGEITRLWIYLAVFFQVPFARFIAKIPKGEILFFGVACLLIIQTVLTLNRVSFIGP